MVKETSLENVRSSAEESDPRPGMGNSPKNKSFHYGNKNVKHDKKKIFFLSKKNETVNIYKPKPKGHSLIPVRFPAVWGESSGLEGTRKGAGCPWLTCRWVKCGTFEEMKLQCIGDSP